jgi:hypothetical protein
MLRDSVMAGNQCWGARPSNRMNTLSPMLPQVQSDAPALPTWRYAAKDDWCVLHTTYGEWLGTLQSDWYKPSDPITLRGRVRGMGHRQIEIGMFLFWHLDSPLVQGRYGDMRFYLMPLTSIRRIWKERPTWDTTEEPDWWHKFG